MINIYVHVHVTRADLNQARPKHNPAHYFDYDYLIPGRNVYKGLKMTG